MTRRVMEKNPWIMAKIPPASMAAITAAQMEPNEWAAATAVNAPISIIPSTPRFNTPDRSANISPMVAYSTAIEEEMARKELQGMIENKLKLFRKDLNEKELVILHERILSEDPVTLQEIGDKFSITREAVRQSEERLKKKLEEFFKKEFGEEGPSFFKRKGETFKESKTEKDS